MNYVYQILYRNSSWIGATYNTTSSPTSFHFFGVEEEYEPVNFWWDTDWSYRKKITIDHTKVAASLANFPLLISFDN